MADGWGPSPDEMKGWGAAAPAEVEPEPPPAGWGASPEEKMPGAFEALGQGIKSGWHGTSQSIDVLSGEKKPEPIKDTSPAAQPFDMRDLTSPIERGLPKVMHGLGHSWPTLAGGILGGGAGAATPIPGGALIGGAGGAGLGAALQTVGPHFAAELKKTPDDPDGAWDRALVHTGISGTGSAAGWAAFPLKIAQGPLKNLAFQIMGIQPGVSVAEKAAHNVADEKPVTEDLGQAYVQGVVGTAVPAAGHAALAGTARTAGRALRASEIIPEERPPAMAGDLTAPGSPRERPAIEDPTRAPPPTPEELLRGSSFQIDQGANPSRWGSVPFAKQVSKATDWFKDTFVPESKSELALKSEGFMREYFSKRQADRDAIIYAHDKLHNYFEKMPEADRIAFMKAYTRETNVPMPRELQPVADYFKKLLRMTWSLDKDAGSKMGFIENYLPRYWEDPGKAQAFFNERVKSLGPKWFQKKRTLDLIQDGIDAGLKLRKTNPMDIVVDRLVASADMRHRVQLLKYLEDLGAATRIEEPQGRRSRYSLAEEAVRSGWHPVTDPVGNRYAIHPDVVPMWKNTIEAPSLWNDLGAKGSIFRRWMDFKNLSVPIMLGASLFHPLHVAHIHLTDGLVRGWTQLKGGHPGQAMHSVARGFYQMLPFGRYVGKGEALKAREAWLTPEWLRSPEQKGVVKLLTEGGMTTQLSQELKMKGKREFKDALAHGEYGKAFLWWMPQKAVHALQSQIFEKWIPTLKVASYIDGARELAQRRPDIFQDPVKRRAALGAIAKSVDNRYGEMFYSNLFWKKTLKETGIASFLSLGWNLGFVREFGGGAIEPFMRKVLEQNPTREAVNAAKNKTAYALIYMTNAMILNAIISKGMTGENPEGMDYFLPRIGGLNPDGSPRRITNMFYSREVPMLKKHIEEHGGGLTGTVAGIGSMIGNKLMIRPALELIGNKDYYGFNVRDPEDPLYKQAVDVFKHIMSTHFNPIAVTGAKRDLQISGKWDSNDPVGSYLRNITEPEVLRGLAGFGPAPAYASKSQVQNKLAMLYNHYVSPNERPLADRENMEKRREARNELLMAKQKNDPEAINNAAQKLAELGVKAGNIRKVQPGDSDLYMYQRLPQSVQSRFLKELDKEDFVRFWKKSAKKTKADPEIQELAKKYFYGG